MQETVCGLVEKQAAIRPNVVAVSSPQGKLTYKDLNDRANVLASQLRRSGGGSDIPVGLCSKSSLEMLVGALGILKAGAAYLPLDPAYPRERLAFILGDARTQVVVTGQGAAGVLPAGSWNVIHADLNAPLPNSAAANIAPSDAGNDALVYVIYTSGSTGKPKGVEINESSLLNLIRWHHEAFSITAADRATQIAGVGFDAAVWEIWPYLTAGASLHIPDDVTRTEPEALRDWLLSQEITISFLPTILAERILKLSWPANAPLRIVLTGADTLHHYPESGLPFSLVNNYGPTECTVVATSGIVPANDQSGRRPSIGKPILNTHVYILDEKLNQVPTGTPGQLYIAGAGLARSYVNQPELTAEKFIPNPFSSEPGGRLYRTGDLGRYLPDGQIEFLGRIDEQIKIRGYRIEPDEIVNVLTRYPGISAAAVIAREFCGGDKSLVSYIVPAAGSQFSYADLQKFLRAQLPEYMIPGTFVRLAQLPLTQNGKLDRTALPEPTRENTIRKTSLQAPKSEVETRLTKILESLMNLNEIDANDNFFQLGGHSLLGAQILTRIRESFGVNLSLRTIFDHPTIAGMSAEIERLILVKLEAMEQAVAS